MPAPRVPTPILIARGAFAKNPQRAKSRESEPVVHDCIGPPPPCFTPSPSGVELGDREKQQLRDLWFELIADAAPGVLNRSHRWHVESACRLKLKERKGLAKTGDITNLNKHMTQMGMNPAAQSTVDGATFTPPGGKGTFAALHGKAQALRSA
jgi:hypothetical protein